MSNALCSLVKRCTNQDSKKVNHAADATYPHRPEQLPAGVTGSHYYDVHDERSEVFFITQEGKSGGQFHDSTMLYGLVKINFNSTKQDLSYH